MLLAFERWEQYQPGTKLRAWLFTILCHRFVSGKRGSRRHEVCIPTDGEGRARRLAVPEGTVKSRLFRGRQLLRRMLTSYAVEMGGIFG